MVLTIEEVLKRNIVTNRDFGDGEGLVEPEGVGLDVRIDEIWEMIPESEAFLKKKTRKTRDYKLVAKFDPKKDESFMLQPNTFYQFKTVEHLNIPKDVVARFITRFNLLVNGIMMVGYKADPGFEGTISVPCINLTPVPFEIELGCRFAQFEFHEIKGEGIMYRGQWKGDRVFADKEEVQV